MKARIRWPMRLAGILSPETPITYRSDGTGFKRSARAASPVRRCTELALSNVKEKGLREVQEGESDEDTAPTIEGAPKEGENKEDDNEGISVGDDSEGDDSIGTDDVPTRNDWRLETSGR
jgi:hypothetical protein